MSDVVGSWQVCITTAVTVGFACSGTGQPAPVTITQSPELRVSGLSRDTVLSAIDADAHAVATCESLSAISFGLTHVQMCSIAGTGLSDDPTNCDEYVADCLERTPQWPPIECGAVRAADFAHCNATLGQIEDCLNAQVSIYHRYFASLTCANVGNEPSLPIAEECRELHGLRSDAPIAEAFRRHLPWTAWGGDCPTLPTIVLR